jgi:hypothetical protein
VKVSVEDLFKMLIYIFIALFLLWIFKSTRKPKNFPPGPLRLPVVGSFPFMGGSGETPSLLYGISDQVKKHGPIFGFYFGKTPTVVLANYDLVRGHSNNTPHPTCNTVKPELTTTSD